MNNEYKLIVDALSTLIAAHLSDAIHESYEPRKTAEESDHYITTHKEAAARLRAIRADIENLQARKDFLEP